MQTTNQNTDGVIHGARKIAEYMGVSPATITRWRKRFRGSDQPHLCFPAFNIPTGIGGGWRLMAHTDLILEWMRRWSAIDAQQLRNKPVQRRRRKTQRLGETHKPPVSPRVMPTLRESLDQVSPAEQGWIIKNELTPAQRQELGVTVEKAPDDNRRVDTACTCGTATECSAHG